MDFKSFRNFTDGCLNLILILICSIPLVLIFGVLIRGLFLSCSSF